MALQQLRAVEDRIARACEAAGRPRSAVRLLAVSKTRSSKDIRTRFDLDLHAFGENYSDEAVAKQAELSDLPIEWHFIGPVQSNKTRALVEHFDWVQSVDREKIVRRLADQRDPGRPPLNVLLQINIDREPQKAGCLPEELDALADAVRARPELKLRGLMTIPAADHDAGGRARSFGTMSEWFDRLAHRIDGVDTLSMGMTDDLEAAIAAGSTMVRIGTALFGPRPTR